MMNWLISQSIGVSLVAAILLVLHRYNLKRFGIHYTYLLWMMLLLLPASSWLINYAQQWLTVANRQSQLAVFRVYMQQSVGQVELLAGFNLLSGLYWLGASLMLLMLFSQWLYLLLLQRNASALTLTFECTLPVKQHSAVNSPMLCGVFSPLILVPSNFADMDISAQRCVIEHELRHQQRWDLVSNIVAWGLLSIHWFNPLAWSAYRRFRDDQELACDADATQSMSTQQRIRYSETLLHYSQHPILSVINTHYGNKNTLKERIMQLQQHKQHGRKRFILAMMIVTCGLSTALLNQQVMAGTNEKTEDSHPVKMVEPKYPVDAAKNHVSGYVTFKFDITPEGKVSYLRITESQPAGVFDRAATQAFEQWQYPATGKFQKDMMMQLAFKLDPETKS